MARLVSGGMLVSDGFLFLDAMFNTHGLIKLLLAITIWTLLSSGAIILILAASWAIAAATRLHQPKTKP